jgi:hypothetical protein
MNRRARTSRRSQRRVFRQKRPFPFVIVFRQLIAGLLMLAAGLGIAVLLQQLPQQVDVMLLVSEAIADLIRGIQQLLEATLGFAAIVVIASLVILASVLSFGGILRLIRLWRMLLKRNLQGRR